MSASKQSEQVVSQYTRVHINPLTGMLVEVPLTEVEIAELVKQESTANKSGWPMTIRES